MSALAAFALLGTALAARTVSRSSAEKEAIRAVDCELIDLAVVESNHGTVREIAKIVGGKNPMRRVKAALIGDGIEGPICPGLANRFARRRLKRLDKENIITATDFALMLRRRRGSDEVSSRCDIIFDELKKGKSFSETARFLERRLHKPHSAKDVERMFFGSPLGSGWRRGPCSRFAPQVFKVLEGDWIDRGKSGRFPEWPLRDQREFSESRKRGKKIKKGIFDFLIRDTAPDPDIVSAKAPPKSLLGLRRY